MRRVFVCFVSLPGYLRMSVVSVTCERFCLYCWAFRSARESLFSLYLFTGVYTKAFLRETRHFGGRPPPCKTKRVLIINIYTDEREKRGFLARKPEREAQQYESKTLTETTDIRRYPWWVRGNTLRKAVSYTDTDHRRARVSLTSPPPPQGSRRATPGRAIPRSRPRQRRPSPARCARSLRRIRP